MKSEARTKLHKKFMDLEIGTHFQLVNRAMGAAVPKSFMLEKVAPFEGKNAIRMDTGEPVKVFSDTLVEVS